MPSGVGSSETKEQREDRVTQALCDLMTKVEGHTVRIDSYPDRMGTGGPGCDAILDRGGRRVALEQEIVESFQGQKEDDARFREVIVPVESALAAAFPREEILVVVPVGAVPTGIRWSDLSRDLSSGLVRELPGLPHGRATEVALPNVPFRPIVTKRLPIGAPSAMVMRLAPSTELLGIVRDRLSHAAHQLGPYKDQGMNAVALLDSEDVALVSVWDLLGAVAQVQADIRPAGVISGTFIALSYLTPPRIYPAQITDRVFPATSPELEAYIRAQDSS